jgi:type VI secretion system secreted protein Hcp
MQAAFDIFMQIPNIKGESLDEKHPGWIEVMSFSHGISRVDSVAGGGGSTVGKPNHAEVSLMKKLDSSSLPLDLKVNNGEKMSPIVIEFVKASAAAPVVFYRVTLYEASITSVSSSGSGGADSLVDSISINYSKIMWQYYPVDANGKVGPVVTSEWDVLKNVGK